MSYGWVTESALLPKKSKEIPVDSKSFIGLQTQIFELSQEKASNSKIPTGRSLKEILIRKKVQPPPPAEESKEVDNRVNQNLISRCDIYQEMKTKGCEENEKFLVNFNKDSDSSDEDKNTNSESKKENPLNYERETAYKSQKIVKQSYDHTLTQLEKDSLPEVLNEKELLKQQQILIKKKRQERLEARKEKVRKMKSFENV
ncbi:unnamed protein product [Blepharisma stoltei]|uniref:Uncharacterized protein n=1 Tax=Blepharisma stoltei TaxID=1481888 RepID=A0AAU9IFA8_9CILI|nr:unnamed protein product [Blepharisma stoltei]